MIDISDITEMELDEERANKETQKLLLKFNSNLKHIYSTYS